MQGTLLIIVLIYSFRIVVLIVLLKANIHTYIINAKITLVWLSVLLSPPNHYTDFNKILLSDSLITVERYRRQELRVKASLK